MLQKLTPQSFIGSLRIRQIIFSSKFIKDLAQAWDQHVFITRCVNNNGK